MSDSTARYSNDKAAAILAEALAWVVCQGSGIAGYYCSPAAGLVISAAVISNKPSIRCGRNTRSANPKSQGEITSSTPETTSIARCTGMEIWGLNPN